MSSNLRINKVCQECQEQFVAKTTVTKFCSHRCANRSYKHKIRKLKVQESEKETELFISQKFKYPELNVKVILSIKEACQLLGVSKSTIYRLFDDSKLNKVKVRSRVFISRNELKEVFKI